MRVVLVTSASEEPLMVTLNGFGWQVVAEELQRNAKAVYCDEKPPDTARLSDSVRHTFYRVRVPGVLIVQNLLCRRKHRILSAQDGTLRDRDNWCGDSCGTGNHVANRDGSRVYARDHFFVGRYLPR